MMEVEAVAVRLSLFVLNPRLFLELKSLLREHGIEFRVPAGLDDLCPNGELLLVDREALEYIRASGASADACPGVVAVSSPGDAYGAVLARVLGDRSPISIGIDLGKRIAYAVLVGGRLLTCGYTDRATEIRSILERFSSMGPRVILLGIGAQYLKELPNDVLSLIEDERVTAAYMIEEDEVSGAVRELVGESIGRLPEDVRASIGIAIKAYEKYALVRGPR